MGEQASVQCSRPFLPYSGFGELFFSSVPFWSRGIEGWREGCRVGREVSIAHVSRERPLPLVIRWPHCDSSDSIRFKCSDPFPLETVRGGSSRSGFSGEPSSYCEEKKKGAQSRDHSLGTRGHPGSYWRGRGFRGGGKGLSGQTLSGHRGLPRDCCQKGPWVKRPCRPRREQPRPARHFQSKP